MLNILERKERWEGRIDKKEKKKRENMTKLEHGFWHIATKMLSSAQKVNGTLWKKMRKCDITMI